MPTKFRAGPALQVLVVQVVLQVQGILIVSWHVIRMLPTKFGWISRNSVGNKKPPISRWLILLVLNNVPHFI